MDLLLPNTDAGVAFQLAVFLSLALTGIVLTRRRREWLVLSVGITLLGLGLFGVRAVH
jgi:LPXTG-motif cell wall-anchored protein